MKKHSDAEHGHSGMTAGPCEGRRKIIAAPASAYTPQQQAFHRYWYSNMLNDQMTGVHRNTSYASAWATWQAAIAAQGEQP